MTLRMHDQKSLARGRMVRWLSIALLLLAMAASAGSADRAIWPMASVIWPLDRAGAKTITLQIPAGYNAGAASDAIERRLFPHGRGSGGRDVEIVLLETLWPDMAPRTSENNGEFRAPGGGRTLSIEVTSGDLDPASHATDRLHVNLGVDLRSSKHVCVPPPRLPGDAKCHDFDVLSEKPVRFGLQHMGVDFAVVPDVPRALYYRYEDIYYAPSLGDDLRTYITCTPDEAPTSGASGVFNPLCEQHFRSEPLNALVKVRYRRVYLRYWKSIQERVENLLQSFIAPQTRIDKDNH